MEKLLTPDDLEERYGFNKNTQKYKRHLFKKGDPDGLSYVRMGGSIRYTPQQIEQYIEASTEKIREKK